MALFYLGFEVQVDHPNTFVVKCAQLVKGRFEELFSKVSGFTKTFISQMIIASSIDGNCLLLAMSYVIFISRVMIFEL